ncbi:PREDICTED: starch synthase 3, chloroplastic/amyloplastic isoform X2 [Nelumbo nucifera]|uniref:starch synthase n=1 Tax=Nelumbo nucifera TaxID=4432 RepID=A0A1U8QBH3_NELNU|nr:PREDICTED: starch synthase 3, chloroplastic/amyloplastic isoform X2 [Nelumbo nucifera]
MATMEIALQVQRPVCYRTTFPEKTHLKVQPPVRFFSHGRTNPFSHTSPWRKECPTIGLSCHIFAGADFSRRRSRKGQVSRPKGSAAKGFMPKIRVGTSIQRREKSDNDDNGSSSPSLPGEHPSSSKNPAEMKVDTGKKQETKYLQEKEVEETKVEIENKVGTTISPNKQFGVVKSVDIEGNGRFSRIDDGPTKSQKSEIITSKEFEDDVDETPFARKNSGNGRFSVIDDSTSKSQKSEIITSKKIEDDVNETSFARENLDTFNGRIIGQSRTFTVVDEDLVETELDKPKLLDKTEKLMFEEPEMKEHLLKPKMEMDAEARRKVIESLAEENFSRGCKMFVYPEVVKPDQDIEVFLNRNLSTLKNEPDVLIMGAFNDWRWKSFTIKLNKTHLRGDWWSCLVYIPKEAYKMDFVFFNGANVYENNETKDFSLTVEGVMDASTFEDFLLEEKRRELEKLAAEQAEKERQEEERRRIEAEKVASEADRAQARAEAAKERESLHEFIKKAVRSVDNVWYIEPKEFKGGDLVRLYYNRNSRPLAHANELWIHGGHNKWKDGLSIIGRLVHSEIKDGDWWYVDVVVPDRALIMDWVFADGPPGSATVYDNNNFQDFHAIVPRGIPEELYWVEEEQQVYGRLQEERRIREEAIRVKAERTAHMKAETKERTMKMFLLSQKHIVYTEPLDVKAGTTVTVFYNPSNTVLNGKPEVWFRCSFNRWTHRNGPLPPQKMLPVDNSPRVKTTVRVPLDAYVMDFVFSEKEDGGIYDNRNGMDYHIPVLGGITKEPPMHIVHVAVEMAPIAKVGGLGDVVTSLSRAVKDLGHNVDIILPKYDCLNLSNVKYFQFHRSYSWGGTEIKVWFGKVEGLPVYFLEPQNGLFSAGCIYGCRNDGQRFGFFCHAALEFLLQSGFHPDILHCHDWSSAPVAWLFKEHYMHYGLSKARVVFTIHNLEFGAQLIGKAMLYSDKATTVSPTYSREVSGNPAIASHLQKFYGILNGIDPDIWDPYNDKFIPVSYTSDNVVEGKRAAKEALQQKLGLKRADLPMVGIITRLTHQKGIHLIKHAIWRTLERNGQVVLLGSAPDPRIQNDFVNLANQLHSSHGDRARLCLTYDEPLSHLIYAGSDFILVPSIFEPCGLTQLTAMRYGSIPVVRKTGGLHDTVFDVDHDKERARAFGLEPNGFNFDGADTAGVDYALNRKNQVSNESTVRINRSHKWCMVGILKSSSSIYLCSFL